MKIFLLGRVEGADYDEYNAKVIRAKNEKQARELANERRGGGGKIWTDEKEVTCVVVTAAGKAEEILGSFNAG